MPDSAQAAPFPIARAARLSIAPMMEWTDKNCRAFHRHLSRCALLYTEMVTSAAIRHGDRPRLLDYNAAEHPVALQLGGSDPDELRMAVEAAAPWGYDEINLNVGCPSDRVQSGTFGAVLMKDPARVAKCVRAMAEVTALPVTVKCRIGVDEQEPAQVLPDFLAQMEQAGVRRVTIHARKAWLAGLSPKDNREIPPLDYLLVHAMKARFPELHLSINGGVDSLDAARAHLEVMDGVMIGRAAYHRPFEILGGADRLWGEEPPFSDPLAAARAFRPYLAAHLDAGGRVHQVTRHMLGLFHGMAGARIWRRTLSEGAPHARNAAEGLALYDAALDQVEQARNAHAETL